MVITFPSKSTKTKQNIYNSNKTKHYFIIVVKELKNENKKTYPLTMPLTQEKSLLIAASGYRTENNANSRQCSEGAHVPVSPAMATLEYYSRDLPERNSDPRVLSKGSSYLL